MRSAYGYDISEAKYDTVGQGRSAFHQIYSICGVFVCVKLKLFTVLRFPVAAVLSPTETHPSLLMDSHYMFDGFPLPRSSDIYSSEYVYIITSRILYFYYLFCYASTVIYYHYRPFALNVTTPFTLAGSYIFYSRMFHAHYIS